MGDYPDVDLIYLPIKPSTSRWRFWPKMKKANQLVREYCDQNAKLHYVDIATPMLNDTGEPLPDIFLQDGLHLNEKGYDIWKQVLRPKLMQLYQIE
jgi:lysophospholipase L1-like esterase